MKTAEVRLTIILHAAGIVSLLGGIWYAFLHSSAETLAPLVPAALEAMASVAFTVLFVRTSGWRRFRYVPFALIAGGLLAHYAHQFVAVMQNLTQ